MKQLQNHAKRLFCFFLPVLCFLISACSSSSKPTLHLFSWPNFFDMELIKEFEKKYNCYVVIDSYDSNESMYAKLKMTSTGYDLIFPSSYYVGILQKQGMIQPLDQSKIENIKNLDKKYFKEKSEIFNVPFIISFTGIAYRKDRIPPIDPSWSVFGRHDLKGRMTMLNDYRETLGAALKFLGHSVNSKEPSIISEAGDLLISWKKNLAKFESEQYKNGIASAEFLVVHGYSIDITQVMSEDPNIVFIYPKEGNVMSIDYIAIPQGAKNVALAHDFINFMLDPEIAAKNISYTNSLMPVVPAYELLDAKKRENPILFPPKEALEKMELIEDLGDTVQFYYKTWDRVKAA